MCAAHLNLLGIACRAPLLDDLGGLAQDRLRDREAERLGGSAVDHQLEVVSLLDGQVGRLRSCQDPGDQVGAVTDEFARHGPLDILINNAGINKKKPVVDTSDAELASIVQTHLFGSYALSRECGRRMIVRGHGSIIMIVSMTALFGVPQVSAYGAAKAALVVTNSHDTTNAVESVLGSFEAREDYLEDVPVADTVLVLQALAARRGIAAELSSSLLPAPSAGA